MAACVGTCLYGSTVAAASFSAALTLCSFAAFRECLILEKTDILVTQRLPLGENRECRFIGQARIDKKCKNRLDPYLSGDRKVAPIGKYVRKRRRSDYYLLVAGPLRCTNKMVREKWMEEEGKRTYETEVDLDRDVCRKGRDKLRLPELTERRGRCQ